MCNLSEKIYERGIEKGIEQGIEQGIERGKITAYYDMGLTIEEISTKLNMKEEEITVILEENGLLKKAEC